MSPLLLLQYLYLQYVKPNVASAPAHSFVIITKLSSLSMLPWSLLRLFFYDLGSKVCHSSLLVDMGLQDELQQGHLAGALCEPPISESTSQWLHCLHWRMAWILHFLGNCVLFWPGNPYDFLPLNWHIKALNKTHLHMTLFWPVLSEHSKVSQSEHFPLKLDSGVQTV